MQVQNLTEVFDSYYDRLVYFCFKITGDKEQSKDLVQDAFIKYWQFSDTVMTNETAIKNFLYSTVHNAALNTVRHGKVVEGYAVKHNKEEPLEVSAMEAIISAEVVAEIHAAIEALPDHYRQISRLGYFEGKKNQEIADELGMSVNTVKKQKQRALELLRLRLRPEIFMLLLVILK